MKEYVYICDINIFKFFSEPLKKKKKKILGADTVRDNTCTYPSLDFGLLDLPISGVEFTPTRKTSIFG